MNTNNPSGQDSIMVIKLEKLDSRRVLVSFDNDDRLPLYLGEARKYQLEENAVISASSYQEICSSLQHRCRLYAMHLLEKKDYSEAMLLRKLKEKRYPLFLAEDALSYVKSYHYVDDERYASTYISQMQSRKSRRQIQQELARKGISSDIAESLLEENIPDEHASALVLARKKVHSAKPKTPQEWQKIVRFLMGKGYPYSVVESVIEDVRREAF